MILPPRQPQFSSVHFGPEVVACVVVVFNCCYYLQFGIHFHRKYHFQYTFPKISYFNYSLKISFFFLFFYL